MLVLAMVLHQFPGYTMQGLLEEDPFVVDMLIDVARAAHQHEKAHEALLLESLRGN